jgi:hypothetical protein
MKKLLFSLTALALSTLVFAQKKADEVAKFQSETIDLGKIKVGTPTTAKFTVANIGNEPLIIEQANPTCGCTISNYTKEPIASGKSGEINATYNAASVGAFEKHLTVKFAGTSEPKSITIKGEVVSADDYAKLKGEPVPAKEAVVAAPVTESKTTGVETKTKTKTATAKAPAKTKTKTKTTAVKATNK